MTHMVNVIQAFRLYGVLLYFVLGLVIGAVGHLIIRGRGPGGWVFAPVAGVLGAFLGGFIGRSFGTSGLLLSALLAATLVVTYEMFHRQQYAQ